MEKLPNNSFGGHLPVSRGRNTLLRARLLELEIGEILFMPREEWKTKNGPYYIIRNIKKSTGRRFEYGMKTDGTGWLFRRVA